MPTDVEQVLISIPLCTFNGEEHLRPQLDSLLAQTYATFEVIAVDDGSTDATLAILYEYASRDTRFCVIRNAQNLGFKKNFEYAMKLCSGVFIAPSDQDDIWTPDKLESLMKAIGNQAMAYCDSEMIDGDGKSMGIRMSDALSMPTTGDTVAFAFDNCVSGHAMLFRRSLLEEALPVPEEFFHDWWLAAVATCRGGIIFLDRVLVLYRRHLASVTVRMDAQQVPEDIDPLSQQLRGWHEVGKRIALLSRLPGEHQIFLRKWSRLWDARVNQWFSPAFAWLMIRHGKRIHMIKGPWARQLAGRACSRPLRYTHGFRLKRFSNIVKQWIKWTLPISGRKKDVGLK